jgi:hypothetical protein
MPSQNLGDLFRGLMRPVGNGRDNREEDVLGVKRPCSPSVAMPSPTTA